MLPSETPPSKQVAEKLFLPGELGKIASAVNDLCGVTSQAEVDETVKN